MTERGPFRVVRETRGTWKIVNRMGEVERLGYRDKPTANEVCRLMNDHDRTETHPLATE